jgi:hypothetical protein
MWYPGIADFAETSCIAAIEAQACGTPFVGSLKGALPETAYPRSKRAADRRRRRATEAYQTAASTPSSRCSTAVQRAVVRLPEAAAGRAEYVRATPTTRSPRSGKRRSTAGSRALRGEQAPRHAAVAARGRPHRGDGRRARHPRPHRARSAASTIANATDAAIGAARDALDFCERVIQGKEQTADDYAAHAIQNPLDEVKASGRLQTVGADVRGLHARARHRLRQRRRRDRDRAGQPDGPRRRHRLRRGEHRARHRGRAKPASAIGARSITGRLGLRRSTRRTATRRSSRASAVRRPLRRRVRRARRRLHGARRLARDVPRRGRARASTPARWARSASSCRAASRSSAATCTASSPTTSSRLGKKQDFGADFFEHRPDAAAGADRALDHPLPDRAGSPPGSATTRRGCAAHAAAAEALRRPDREGRRDGPRALPRRASGHRGRDRRRGHRLDRQTKRIAARYGARVLDLPPIADPADGFAGARNAVLDACTGDWFLWIDADEQLVSRTCCAATSRRRLQRLRPAPARTCIWTGAELRHPGPAVPPDPVDPVLRLHPRAAADGRLQHRHPADARTVRRRSRTPAT